MGLDVEGILAYGVVIPQDFAEKKKKESTHEEISLYEVLDDLVYEYPALQTVLMGSCDDPIFVVASKVYETYWTNEPLSNIDLYEVFLNYSELERFLIDNDLLKLEPSWHLGCYCSY